MLSPYEDPSPSLWSRLSRTVEGPMGCIFSLLTIPLLLAALWFPPISLFDRLDSFSSTRIDTNGGIVADPDGTRLLFAAEDVESAFSVNLDSLPQVDFIETRGEYREAYENLPNHLTPKSPFYAVSVSGNRPNSAILEVPIPNDSLPYETLALYMWANGVWQHLPNMIFPDIDMIEARLNFVPESFMVMQTNPPFAEVAASLEMKTVLPEPARAAVANEFAPGLILRGDGALDSLLPGGYAPVNNGGKTMPVLRNWEGPSWQPAVRTDLINNMLLNSLGEIENQIARIKATVIAPENNYPGVVIDYRGIDAVPSAIADYANFIRRLSEELHSEGRLLVVRVEEPQQISAELWNTQGHDWRALGAVADTIIIPAPEDPLAYQPGGSMEALLRFAVSEVDRRKIQIEFPTQSVERTADNYLILKGYSEALKPLTSEIKNEGSDNNLELALDNSDQVTWNETLGMYSYQYTDAQGQTRTVYLESANSIARKIDMLQRYNIRKISLHTPESTDVDPAIWDVVLKYQQGEPLTGFQSELSVALALFDSDGDRVEQTIGPIGSSSLAFAKPDDMDGMEVKATVLNSAGASLLPATSHSLASILSGRGAASAVSSAVRAASTTSGNSVSSSSAESKSEGSAASSAATGANASSSSANAVSLASSAKVILSPDDLLNVRGGPGLGYTILGQITPGNDYEITGKDSSGEWWEVDIDGISGWVIDSFVQTSGDTQSVRVATDIPSLPVAAPAQQVFAAAIAPPAAAPAVVAAPPPTATLTPQQAQYYADIAAGRNPNQPAAGAQSPSAAAPAPATAVPAPVVAAPPPSIGQGFGYGVQAHMVHANNENKVMEMTKGMNFNWIKQQVEWKVFESNQGNPDFGALEGIVNAANNSGIKLLFSVVNAPPWAREAGFDGSVGGPPADPATFASFNGKLAAKYCGSSVKAIEVWNEQNLHYEWGNKPLNPGEYVELLKASYASIKAACPSMTVVSGALTPAGSNGNLAMDDFQYMDEMLKAGMANYADAIGAHPSGYNVPPSKTAEEACAAIQVSGNSFNGACDSPHHSWSFRSTMEGYRQRANLYGASNKRIWPTEFGWAAGGAFDNRYAYANDNSFEEQAQWTVEAYQMMKSWGWVGPAFLWNLNFRVVADGTEKAQWGIVDNGWNPLPVYNSLRDMPK